MLVMGTKIRRIKAGIWRGLLIAYIAHHYFDLDAEIVYNVVKTNLPEMLVTVKEMILFVKNNDGII